MKTIEDLASEVADVTTDSRGRVDYSFDGYGLERFAALVRAQVLEEAAQVCDARGTLAFCPTRREPQPMDGLDYIGYEAADECADAIRALAAEKAANVADVATPKHG